ncbi:unnamed protein product [Kuraishia capsulata CBS 1993]|uniref:ERCC4 domain-containing protein n=1 Tax=Kuraishia capsulata CBS 1993 TaxID=1382522 RepID=W6MMY3_9ASCO|nr:uncharacterized protein KUCA_T00003546001 [Kuraishia capsulata CBS 1993]CDK27568.1 unnamed protein product [Kuraishia capsulata CBS 1993]
MKLSTPTKYRVSASFCGAKMSEEPLFIPNDEDQIDHITEIVNGSYDDSAVVPVDRNEGFDAELFGEDGNSEIPVTREENDSEDEEIDPTLDPIEVSLSVPLKYQQRIVEEMVASDALLILGRGLGLETITANMLHALSAPGVKYKSLVIVIGAEEKFKRISEELMELSWIDDDPKSKGQRFVNLHYLTTAEKRKECYQQGGIMFVSSTVFVVDMVSEVIDANLITGLVILGAERISETSRESFIIHLYRERNKWGFVKALSDQPERFQVGFRPLYTKLKDLRLSKTMLWPRFHVDVRLSLSDAVRHKPGKEVSAANTVTEINVSLTESMKQIQIALIACVKANLDELKRHNPLVISDYWDVANVLDHDFVSSIRRALDAVWHRVTPTTRQVIHDIGDLKDLLNMLLVQDSIQFYQRVLDLIRPPSEALWLHLTEATTIVSYAKKRVLDTIKDQTTKAVQNTYLLEPLPKWDQLMIILEDISIARRADSNASGPVLIVCSSPVVSSQLQTLIRLSREESDGTNSAGRRLMAKRLVEHLTWKESRKMESKKYAEVRRRQAQKQPEPELITSKTFRRGQVPDTKRRRTRGASAVAAVGRLHAASSMGTDQEMLDVEIVENLGNHYQEENDMSDSGEDDELKILEEYSVQNDGTRFVYDYVDPKSEVIVETFDSIKDDLLQELMPSYIISYEPHLSFIRQIEVYQAMNQDSPAKTFFMYYGDSIEEQKHLVDIKKEKDAFTKLIREKASLATHFRTDEDNDKFSINKSQVVNTRIAGGSNFRTSLEDARVIVDMREFRSSLPNLLYRIGLKILPLQIAVGDYVISPKICLERKSILDLIGSLQSGRLYSQCEQMFRYYETPVLLIEFDEGMSFSFEPFSELRTRPGSSANPIRSKLSQQDIQSKLTILLVAFPKLKIIWSSSPYQTAQTILELKASLEEPDMERALAAGQDQVAETDGPPQYNESAIDFLQTIPGINPINYNLIIKKVKNLREFAEMSEEALTQIIGAEAAHKAYSFLREELF